jgi:Mn2+/Fe2+ NRAMP family transporter
MTEQETVVRGMPLFSPGDPETLAREREELRELGGKPFGRRIGWYFAKSGPGWMQSAMTLGGGSAMASLFAGAFLQYQLLWVQPLAMILGIIMLSALSHQTLSTNARPFYAMKQFVHPALAWAWALSTLLATVIWHFPQYALAAGMTEDIIKALTGLELQSQWAQTALLLGLGLVFFFVAVKIAWNYGSGRRGVKVFENIIKAVIWFIIFCFAVVVISSSFSERGIDWGKVLAGFLPFSFASGSLVWNIPTDPRGVTILMAGFSAAVGINMTFLFGYSYLAKGWGKEHRGLAKFDLITGMLVPYTLATALMVIAAGTTIYGTGALGNDATNLSPIQAARLIQAAGIPLAVSRVIFGLGIIGMAMNAIVLHMLVAGFAACEIFGVEPGGWKYKLATLVPAPGILGAVLWGKIGAWIAIPTSAICLVMLPIAYIGFFLLNNSERFLAEEKPRGTRAFWWNTGMLVAIVVTVVSAIYMLMKIVPA